MISRYHHQKRDITDIYERRRQVERSLNIIYVVRPDFKAEKATFRSLMMIIKRTNTCPEGVSLARFAAMIQNFIHNNKEWENF